MEERIKQLIKEYKEEIEFLMEREDIALNEGNEFEIIKIGTGIFTFEGFIEDLEDLLTL